MKKLLIFITVLISFVVPSTVYADEYLNEHILGLVSGYSNNNTDVIDLGTNGTCTNTLAYDNVSGDNNLRYVGNNPCNFISFNGEMWRIIGVFESGTHGQSGKKLVKIIRYENLGTWMFDNKQNGVGSSTGSSSNDWTDSELMMLLNPASYMNTGVDSNGTATHNYTLASGTETTANYVKDKKNIFRNMGSYFYGLTVYKPAQVGNNGWNSTATANINTLQPTYRDMVAEAGWHTRGTSKSTFTPLELLDIERNSGSTFRSRAVHWTGKVGLMYGSDYGLATSGGSTMSRSECLTNSNVKAWTTTPDCVNNNWLRYVANANATSDTDATTPVQWTMMPSPNYGTSTYKVNGGTLAGFGSNTTSIVRPVLYLTDDTVVTGGNGTWSNPYTLVHSEVNKYTVTYTDGVDNEVVFADQVYTDVPENASTPAFNGTPTRTGYTFVGWNPTVASTVTGDVTYVAVWQSNQIQHADLEINKQVTGNMADIDELFELQITVTDNGVGINGSFDYYVGSTLQQNQLTFTNGVATVNISSTNNVTIKDMEVGYDYSISEAQANGYTATTSTITGTINDTSNVVTFVNNKEQAPETGREVDLKFAYSFILIGPLAILFFKKSKMK